MMFCCAEVTQCGDYTSYSANANDQFRKDPKQSRKLDPIGSLREPLRRIACADSCAFTGQWVEMDK